MAGGMGRGGQVASFEALTQGDGLEANNPAPNGLALGNEQALCAYADRAVAITQQAGGEAHTTGRDGRLRLQAYPLADPSTRRRSSFVRLREPPASVRMPFGLRDGSDSSTARNAPDERASRAPGRVR